MNYDIKEVIKSLDLRKIDFSSSVSIIDYSNYSIEYEKLVEKYKDEDRIKIHLSNNLTKLIDSLSENYTDWDSLIDPDVYNILERAFIATIEDLEKPKLEDLIDQNSAAMPLKDLSVNEIDEKCPFMPLNLELDSWLDEAHNNGKRFLLCVADTGAGKTLKLIKWLSKTHDNLQSGIILTHCNTAAEEIYNHLKYLDKSKENSVLLFNADPKNKEMYEKIKKNPSLFGQYNWVICFNMRLMQTDTNVMFAMMSAFKNYGRIRNNNKTYLISDEGILSSGVDQLSRVSIDQINVVSNNALAAYVDNPTSETKDGLESYFNNLCDRINALTDAKNILPEDASILSSFTDVKVEDSTLYQLKVYMARLSAFFDYIFNSYDEFRKKYKDIVNYENFIKYDIPIIDVAGLHNLIVFDATGEINYGYDNKFFYIKKLAKLPRNIFDFYITDLKLPNRKCTKEEFEQCFIDMKNSGFKFKDDSVIIWWSFPYYEGSYEAEAKLRIERYLAETGTKRCLVTYFNGAEIRGDNRFSRCTNVYILGNYKWNNTAIGKAIKATMNSSFCMESKFCGDTVQCIGRTKARKSFGVKLLDSDPGVVDIYINADVSSNNIASILNYYGIKPNRMKMNDRTSFDKFVDVAISNANTSEKKVVLGEYSNISTSEGKSRFVDHVKYLADKCYNGIHEISVRQICEDLGISKVELAQFAPAIETLNYIGLSMKIFSKRSELKTEYYTE